MRASSPTFATAKPALSRMIDSISSSTRTVPCSETALNPWKVSARRTRLDNEAAAIAGLGSLRPVVIVQHSTMGIIDGVHRLCAAELRGGKYIETKFFYGDDIDAFVLAVKANIAHGPADAGGQEGGHASTSRSGLTRRWPKFPDGRFQRPDRAVRGPGSGMGGVQLRNCGR